MNIANQYWMHITWLSSCDLHLQNYTLWLECCMGPTPLLNRRLTVELGGTDMHDSIKFTTLLGASTGKVHITYGTVHRATYGHNTWAVIIVYHSEIFHFIAWTLLLHNTCFITKSNPVLWLKNMFILWSMKTTILLKPMIYQTRYSNL